MKLSALVIILAGLSPAAPAWGQAVGHDQSPYVLVLGIAQDGGFPQAGCRKPCCRDLAADDPRGSGPVCLAIVDPQSDQRWLLECTPDFPRQLADLNQLAPLEGGPGIDGILLTHAHIGHYAGLVHLGREVMGADGVPVYAMPRMREFLSGNGPWSQLVELGNIELRPLTDGQPVQLNERIRVTPLTVPHRDEFSETVGYRIDGPRRSVFFLPDIDKWERWETAIESVVADVDLAFLDATFFDDQELPGRNMAEIPHPFVVETIRRFASRPADQRARIRLLHFNHSNPVLDPDSPASERLRRAGLGAARRGDRHDL